MTITYRVGSGLYINVTNRCTNSCVFCERELVSSVGDSGSLWLEREPTREEIWEDIQKRELGEYSEVVFCGFGEPTERLDDLLWLCGKLKEEGAPPIRVNTNGHASLIAGADTAPSFEGLVDALSISLNAHNAEEYARVCRPVFGIGTYDALIDFSRRAAAYVPKVVLSVVEGVADVDACRKVAGGAGLPLKVRERL